MEWVCQSASGKLIDCESLGLGRVLTELLAARGLQSFEEVQRFLEPALKDMVDPYELSGVKATAERLIQAREKGERIAVVGDYDVDGVTSTTLLVSVLRELGLDPTYYVPLRMEDGYGLSQSVIDRVMSEQELNLLVALDCGTNSVEEVEALAAKGIDVIIIDHHKAKEETPPSAILVNPHVFEEPGNACYHLCTVGLVFKVIHGLTKRLRELGCELAGEIRLRPFLDLVAMGTVADLVPLTGENRLMTSFGLKHLQAFDRPGLSALAEVSGLDREVPLRSSDISFRLGPRINASGRLADAQLPVDMLLSEDSTYCHDCASQLEQLNRERQEIERAMVTEAEAMVGEADRDALGLVLYSDGWHPGVVGIVAGKLAREFHRPCIVLGAEETLAKGSCRSIAGVNLVEVLSECADLLESWGGHPMAAGVSLQASQVDAFREAFRAALERAVHGKLPDRQLAISLWLKPAEVGSKLLLELDRLHPYGQENPEPVFALSGVRFSRPPQRFGNGHFRFQFAGSDGETISGVAWRKGDQMPEPTQVVDMAVRLNWNYWQGRRQPQAELLDWRPAQ